MKRLKTPEVVASSDCASRMIADIKNANTRIHLQAMDFDAHDPMSQLLTEISKKANQGVTSSITFDYRMHALAPLATRKTVRSLRHSHVIINNVGHPWLGTPIIRRSHVKLHVIDDIVYVGGLNLAGESFANRDVMLRYDSDAELAVVALEIQQNTRSRTPGSDSVLALNDQNSLLIDGGINGSSIILDQSIDMTKSAKTIWYLSQFAPSPALAKHIKRAPSSIVKFNTVSSQPGLIGKSVSMIDNLTTVLMNQYDNYQKIHAKILIIQKDDGSYELITGSHNFALSGVLFGTREIALRSSDQSLARELISFVENA